MLESPGIYNVANWLSMGLLDLGKGAINPEKPLSLEHWLDSLGFASALYGMYETGKRAVALRKKVLGKRGEAGRETSHVEQENETVNELKPPKVYKNAKEQITNGVYTIDTYGMEKHLNGTPGKSQFLYDVDAEKAVLDASFYADKYHLWRPSSGNTADFADKAKVSVINGNVGVSGNGELTNYINVYRTKKGFVHGCPGNPES